MKTMLRHLCLTLLLTSILPSLHAQKQDNVWVFGYRYFEDSLANGIFFRFDDSLKITYKPKPMDFYTTSACVSDSVGNLLLYSNGCYIEHADGVEVEGSAGLNPGTLYDIFCTDNLGYNMPTGMIVTPDPKNPSLNHFFHYPVVGSTSKNLLHTLVDLSANNNQGTTLFKNQPIVLDTISPDGMHAVKHANGRDWWIIATKYKSDLYYILLLSPSGLSIQTQTIGVPALAGAGGQFVFSPDGTKVARFNAKDDLRIFDFDRCTGVLSNPVFIPIEDDADNNLFAGLAWSADGRYLYAAEIKRILQFDSWASNIAATKKIVAERPTALSPYLAYLELGPDGHIYATSLGGQFFMHRIKHPERGELACEVEQSYFELEYPYANLPHFPNYRLGPLDGSVCDTLGIDNHPLAGWRYDKTGGLGIDFTSVSWYEPETWWWDFGDPGSGPANQTNVRNPSHQFSAPGAYQVCLTVSNTYGSDTKCKWVWVSTVGTDDLPSGADQIILFPNPTSGLLQWNGTADSPVMLRVFNGLGQLQVERMVSDGQTDLSQLQEGLYYLQLFSASDNTLLTSQTIILTQ